VMAIWTITSKKGVKPEYEDKLQALCGKWGITLPRT